MKKEERVIDRLNIFAEWCKEREICATKNDFERICGLSRNYLYNSTINTKSSIGSDHLIKIYNRFGFLNLSWLLTGKGEMIVSPKKEKERYEALLTKYERLKAKIDELKDIIDE